MRATELVDLEDLYSLIRLAYRIEHADQTSGHGTGTSGTGHHGGHGGDSGGGGHH